VRLAPAELAPTCHAVGLHAGFDRCRECGTLEQRSLPGADGLQNLYRDTDDVLFLAEERGRRRTARRILDLLGVARPGVRALDVGCGHGFLLDEARDRGYEVEGLEPSGAAAAYARDALGLPVREVPLELADLEREQYDLVVLTDVLEHLADPVAAIERCAELLAPDGALVVATPDPASVAARLAGRRWWSYIPAHCCLIPRVTLRELITATGLVIEHDGPLRRTFSLGYWASGLLERTASRGQPLARSLAPLLDRVPVTLSLGDERLLVARRVMVRRPPRPLIVDRGEDTRVHVVLPAYNAARTVSQVVAALPADVIDRALLVDDASSDATVERALADGLDVLIHPRNRGYGANQKTCYVRAALDGADVVVMVHADNQYDPAFVAAMVRPIEEGRADIVIGSRLLQDEATAGGMPRWKWLGNRGLTWIENLAFRRDFSEYHTGYRAFSISFLRTIPFLRNSDGFAFDQEIFTQIVARGARVVELPIPTRYFLEASSVSFSDSVVYGLRTLMLLVRFRRDEQRRRWPLLRRPAARLGRDLPLESAPTEVPEHAR
jgi:SAM-dependent methyltransferase/GT2 family glycosyltransferase